VEGGERSKGQHGAFGEDKDGGELDGEDESKGSGGLGWHDLRRYRGLMALEARGSTVGVGADVGRAGGGGRAMRRGRRHTSSIRFFFGKLLEMDGFLGRKLVAPMVITLFF
jgi:hypothetical protein